MERLQLPWRCSSCGRYHEKWQSQAAWPKLLRLALPCYNPQEEESRKHERTKTRKRARRRLPRPPTLASIVAGHLLRAFVLSCFRDCFFERREVVMADDLRTGGVH